MTSVIVNINQIGDVLGIYPEETKSNLYKYLRKPEFIYLGGSSFKTVGSPPVFANDCIGCGELGDISVSHSSPGAEVTNYNFDANCLGVLDVIERGSKLNEFGEKIGDRCVVSDGFGESRIVWTESENDFWIISAPTLLIAREFENSDVYKKFRKNRK